MQFFCFSMGLYLAPGDVRAVKHTQIYSHHGQQTVLSHLYLIILSDCLFNNLPLSSLQYRIRIDPPPPQKKKIDISAHLKYICPFIRYNKNKNTVLTVNKYINLNNQYTL